MIGWMPSVVDWSIKVVLLLYKHDTGEDAIKAAVGPYTVIDKLMVSAQPSKSVMINETV